MVGAASRRPTVWSRDTPWPISAQLLCLLWSVLLVTQAAATANSAGCADGSREALLGFERVAGCAGQWAGHVLNASALCGPGWRVCSWYDHTLLSNVSWSDATRYPGCYAFNAAQDGGLCQECRDDLEQDDMAGVGRDCAHQHRGESSCISGGRIDSSCCTDSHFHRACTYNSHLTGVLCCRMPVKPPVIVVKPERTHVYTGLIFLLPCRATGMPPPRIRWYKNGEQMPSNHPRTSVLSSGDLLVTMAKKSDTARYTCEVINDEGFDMASSYVTVTEYSSGCADDSTEGFLLHRDLHACAGRWKGHVKQGGKALCKKGWRVCNPKDRDSLARLTWLDIFDLSGCYAYNAATGRRGRCTKCRRGKMSGVGRHCEWKRHTQSSCLARGRIDVQPPGGNSTSCTHVEGVTSGVLCCKRKKAKKKKRIEKKPGRTFTCIPSCENGGKCVTRNRCKCSTGYKGARCQNAICDPGCGPKGQCVKPQKCRCHEGYGGRLCRIKMRSKCRTPCLNGGRCHQGKCRCPHGYWGKTCQHVLHQFLLSKMNRIER